MPEAETWPVVMLEIADLSPHPKNPQVHTNKQLEQLAARWQRTGWYKNLVVALWEERYTLLAGHGIAEGAMLCGEVRAPCHVREIDPMSPEAVDILVGDNQVARYAKEDERLTYEHLVILHKEGMLLGSGVSGDDFEEMKRLYGAIRDEEDEAQAAPAEPEIITVGDADFEHECPRCHFRW